MKLVPTCPLLVLSLVPLQATTLVQTLDPFDEGNPPLTETSGFHQDFFQSSAGLIPGGWREIELDIQANPFSRTASVGASLSTGEFLVALGGGLIADVALVYDNNGSGLNSFDMTVGNASFLGLSVGAADANFEITIDLTDSFGESASLSFTESNPISNETLLTFHYSDFTNASNLDFTQIESMRYQFDNGPSGDYSLTMLGLYAIPEPSAALFLLFASGLTLRHRSRT